MKENHLNKNLKKKFEKRIKIALKLMFAFVLIIVTTYSETETKEDKILWKKAFAETNLGTFVQDKIKTNKKLEMENVSIETDKNGEITVKILNSEKSERENKKEKSKEKQEAKEKSTTSADEILENTIDLILKK